MEKKKIKLKTRFLFSVVLGILAFIMGFCGSWFARFGDNPQKIKETELAIKELCNDIGKEGDFKGSILLAFSWKDLEKATDGLVYENERIAKAKALICCKEKPAYMPSFREYLWEARYEVSSREWVIQAFGSRVLIGLGMAVLSCVGMAIGIFLILTIIPWLWYFLLERISELSRTIQGK